MPNKECVQRLAKDVKFIIKNPLDNENIYYKHDEENILKGRALIFGNRDTPYNFGVYLFEFNFTENYPYEPPKVKYITNDGKTRFNPNLYVDGKVCLSILNTWQGEGWTSCQSIYSILLTLVSILNEKPLLNEPGIKDNKNNKHPDAIRVQLYNYIITYKSLEFSIIKQYELINSKKTTIFNQFNIFNDIICQHYKKNKKEIIELIDSLREKLNSFEKPYIENNILNLSTYRIKFTIDIDNLDKSIKKFLSIY